MSFTSTEGTWVSLDVSPDGKTIAFDLLNDIYLMPAEGGAAGEQSAHLTESGSKPPAHAEICRARALSLMAFAVPNSGSR